jgi:hypothetical protein
VAENIGSSVSACNIINHEAMGIRAMYSELAQVAGWDGLLLLLLLFFSFLFSFLLYTLTLHLLDCGVRWRRVADTIAPVESDDSFPQRSQYFAFQYSVAHAPWLGGWFGMSVVCYYWHCHHPS